MLIDHFSDENDQCGPLINVIGVHPLCAPSRATERRVRPVGLACIWDCPWLCTCADSSRQILCMHMCTHAQNGFDEGPKQTVCTSFHRRHGKSAFFDVTGHERRSSSNHVGGRSWTYNNHPAGFGGNPRNQAPSTCFQKPNTALSRLNPPIQTMHNVHYFINGHRWDAMGTGSPSIDRNGVEYKPIKTNMRGIKMLTIELMLRTGSIDICKHCFFICNTSPGF
jgi:hypothetical protein